MKLIVRYFASRQKRQEYNWRIINNWAFRSSLPTGRQVSSVLISEENKVTCIISDTHINEFDIFLKCLSIT